ncbi:MAG TPA: hypothetical protein VF133_00635 [Terriglobales bacterium]
MTLLQQWTEREQEKLKIATEIALEAGALARCSNHDELFFKDLHKRTAAVELAHRRFEHCELPNIFRNRRELTDFLSDAITSAPLECRWCAAPRAATLPN